MAKECSCSGCVSACEHVPGWFKPGEAEKVAAFLGMSLERLFREHLSVEYWIGGNEVFALRPNTDHGVAGQLAPYKPMGRCVFLKDGKCGIHAVKPFECREFLHGDPDEIVNARHEQVADSWRTEEAQAQIRTLYGSQPSVPKPKGLFEWLL